MLIVKSKLKELAKGMSVGGDVADGLNILAIDLIKKSSVRAEANGRKTVQPKDVLIGAAKTEPMIVVKSKIKTIVPGFNISGDFADSLNSQIIWHFQQACARAQANGRKTVQIRDI